MKQMSSKYLNLNLLSAMANSGDGYVILITNFGHVMGRLYYAGDQMDETMAGIISAAKDEVIKNMREEDVEFIGDGSMICVKEAIVTYAAGHTLSFDELTLHCDQIVGFSPIDRESYVANLEQE
ncbi:hypothetical protein J0J80_10230 [Turicibacter bilis]|uniref:hypothetical protein n=1 Tax=Turicibacter bilis TaxID=2735723 RepID=UPI001BAFF267|nr:hypothetical protein [Turicibacter bilis]MBS3202480.1 hypothetical protein [Turicibacter bilis]MDD5984972.1 hypothetical protein [Turicibacter sp.]MDY4815479.1 hypothetical protein [Turicibacter bilis]UUF10396.1 hypothetical protein J0J80_10230 [Turicibacter bilis]